MFSAAISLGHQTPDRSAFECRLILVTLLGVPGHQPWAGAALLVPLVLRLPASWAKCLLVSHFCSLQTATVQPLIVWASLINPILFIHSVGSIHLENPD
jgi:hypothetical protein